MIIEISVACAVLIFAVLAYFIIRTLVTFQHTLRRLNHLTKEVEGKMKHLETSLHAFSNLGDICNAATHKLKKAYFAPREEFGERHSRAHDIADLIVVSMELGKKFFTRRE